MFEQLMEEGGSGVMLPRDPRPRLRWTPDLHDRFVDAVTKLGGPDNHHGGHHHYHVHDSAVSSVSIVSEGTVDVDEVNDWLETLVEEKGDDLYRMKGVISVNDSTGRYVFQGVHSMLEGCPAKPWGADEKRINKLVFIGRHLDETALRKAFRGCLVENAD